MTVSAASASAAARMIEEFETHPNALARDDHRDLWRDLIDEEHAELVEAVELDDRAKIARELADLTYVLYGTARLYEIDLDEALVEIHRAAMDKISAGLRRGDGKIIKPPGFVPPDMSAAIGVTPPAELPRPSLVGIEREVVDAVRAWPVKLPPTTGDVALSVAHDYQATFERLVAARDKGYLSASDELVPRWSYVADEEAAA